MKRRHSSALALMSSGFDGRESGEELVEVLEWERWCEGRVLVCCWCVRIDLCDM